MSATRCPNVIRALDEPQSERLRAPLPATITRKP
jgi:hypothetical protein